MLTEELDIRRVASALSPSQLAELREAEDGLPARIDHEHQVAAASAGMEAAAALTANEPPPHT